MKVEVFSCYTDYDLQNEINKCIETIEGDKYEVVDIKFATNTIGDEGFTRFSALIMYRKTSEKEAIDKKWEEFNKLYENN